MRNLHRALKDCKDMQKNGAERHVFSIKAVASIIDRAITSEAEVEKLKQRVADMRCCGNCKIGMSGHYGFSCPVKGDRVKPSDKCDKWEAAGNG